MKAFLFASAALLGIAGINTQADAQNYPWCAYYGGGDMGGGTNCGFISFDQCMGTVSGIGGICMRNTQIRSPSGCSLALLASGARLHVLAVARSYHVEQQHAEAAEQ